MIDGGSCNPGLLAQVIPARQIVCLAAPGQSSAEIGDRLTKNPEDRREAARQCIESVSGKLHGFWYAFGAYDGYNLWEAPDDVSMAAVAIAIGDGGALPKFETTRLLTVEETLDALHRAQTVAYRPPGA